MNVPNGHSAYYSDDATGRGREYERVRQVNYARRQRGVAADRAAAAADPVENPEPSFMVDFWSLLRPAARRWWWLILGAIAGAVGGAALGSMLWKTHYTATAQIVEHKAPVATDAYTPQQLVGPTLVGMVKSPEIMKAIQKKMAAAGKSLAGSVNAAPERMSQIVTITATANHPADAIELANMYSAEVIDFTREHQRKEAEEADNYVKQELASAETELAAAHKVLPKTPFGLGDDPFAPGSGSAAGPAVVGAGMSPTAMQRLAEQLENERLKLDELLVKFTDAHPAVKNQRSIISDLEKRVQLRLESVKGTATDAAGDAALQKLASGGALTRDEWEMAYMKVRNLDKYVNDLRARQRAIQVFKASPPGNFRPMQLAHEDTVSRHTPLIGISLLAGFFGMLGLVLAGAELLRREFFDTRLKTESDVVRVTDLPVLASLGDVRRMSLAAREAWAFRAWIALQDRLAYSPNHGLICGITSSNAGDGRSTWINLLAGAARKCGFRVLTIATRPTADAGTATEEAPEAAAEAAEPEMAHAGATAANGTPAREARPETRDARPETRTNGHTVHPTTAHANRTTVLSHPHDLTRGSGSFAGESEFTALTASALFTPAMVTEKLMGTETDPLVHIPLPGWTWNLERRKQWQGALNVWRKIDNVVILVELPPASMPESVLLASNLPNLLWLVESGKSDANETRAQLKTLRHARCNLVGSVINRAMAPVAGGRFARWLGCSALFALLGLTQPDATAQDAAANANPAATATSVPAAAGAPDESPDPTGRALVSFSVKSPAQRAAWQRKLTLGPGDVVNLSLYGEPELAREEVAIGPDGRISYLEAHDILAAGLTVDELREKLNEELAKYRRTPQAFVTPAAYKSKKYHVLGRVMQRGSFPLDRPTTLLEAVARAGGLETGLASDRSMMELADLKRAFVSRNGERLKVDFEQLFLHGDLTQNVALEPDDYIYFPGGGEKEVHVLGAVRAPGPHVYTTSVGVIGAIAGRGGFSDRAWTKRVLVVRGGLGAPETFKVDAADVLTGRAPDVVLQPKDIVYVADRPWIFAEELLDAATNAFVTSAIVVWTGDKVSDPTR